MTAMSDGRFAQERTPRGVARPEPRRLDLHRLELSGSALLGGAEGASLATRLAGLSSVSTVIANPLMERAVVLLPAGTCPLRASHAQRAPGESRRPSVPCPASGRRS